MDWVLLGQQLWYGLVIGANYVIFAIGLTLVFGVMRVVNMAHGELYMLGAMVFCVLMGSLGMNYFLAAALSIGLMGAFGFIFNRAAIRPLLAPAPMGIFLSTMALSYVMIQASTIIWGGYPKSPKTPFMNVINIGGMQISENGIVLLVVVAISLIALNLLIKKTGIGKTMRATSQNMVGAKLVGVDVTRVYDYTMVLAAIMAAIGGILISPIRTAYPFMGQSAIVMGFVVVIVGGMGNIWGNVAVGFLIGLIEALFAQFVSPYWRMAVIYGFMVIVLILKPRGLFTRS